MKIHEYQAKELFKKFQVAVPKGVAAFSTEDALNAVQRIGFPAVVKAQIHAGGRGKGGGVKIVKDIEEAKTTIEKMLGMILVTHQTGPQGKKVQRLLIEEAVALEKEFYAGIVLDREKSKNVVMVSTEGGVEIEKVAEETPEKIVKVWVDPMIGLRPFQARYLAYSLGLLGDSLKQATNFLLNLYQLYVQSDASLAEINPLALLKDGRIVALDAKINFDDNALDRHPEYSELRDLTEEEPAEIEASKYNLNYIKLDGQVGCMVNGAGLAMATMDIIKYYGSEPANFLDVGGSANKDTVAAGFKIILSDPNVKAILINIFGGIVRCDRVANGVMEAVKEENVTVPVVIRLEGTNSVEAAEILKNSGMNFIVASDLSDAAQKVVQAVKAN
ncbi:MAG: ADP-forming succinate--CoA ligase subunit beta [bacterium]|nr:ADP-forming succinate--CoA ligase subunit beta [bacterium]